MLPTSNQMLELAHAIDYIVQVLSPYLIGVAVILWVVAFGSAAVGARRQPSGAPPRISRLFARTAIGFLIIVLSLCATSVFLTQAATQEIRPRLNAKVSEIRVNGAPARDPERLLSALRQIEAHYHHSHPTTSYRLELETSEGPLQLLLRRDSSVPNEYWVFYRGFETPSDLGKIVTDALD
jgi:hypothetical protein